MKIILASGSPRRAKILESLNIDFEICKSGADEVFYENDPVRTVRENALLKGEAVQGRGVLSADTIVSHNGHIIGKPCDLDEARQFLRMLSGREHSVFTGVAFDGEVCVVESKVRFKVLSDETINHYVELVRPLDRAGAYDIDVCGNLLIESWTGSYENIMGLPVEPVLEWVKRWNSNSIK